MQAVSSSIQVQSYGSGTAGYQILDEGCTHLVAAGTWSEIFV